MLIGNVQKSFLLLGVERGFPQALTEMADEPKAPPKAANVGEAPKPTPETSGVSPSGQAEARAPKSAPASAGGPPSGGLGGPAAPKPAGATPAKPPGAAKAPAKPEVWSSPLLEELQKRFPGAIHDAVTFRKMPSITVPKEFLLSISHFLKGEEGGAYTLLTDQTAVDYPKREKRFDIIYHLYSFKRNDRLRLKVIIGEGETVPSVVSLWPTANWLEREVYDMFGVVYEGHPDLKRILLPDGWTGHPLRKDYDILRQDDAWVKSNLGIDSGQ
jgi:NADH-quinone oxidoreductase subunit C